MGVNPAQGGGSSRDSPEGCDPSGVVVTTVRAHSSDATGAPQLPPTPHHRLALGLGQTGPGRRLSQKQPRYLNSCNHNALNLSSSLANAPAPPTPHYSLHQIWDKDSGERDFGLHLSEAQVTYLGSASVPCKCMSPTYSSTPLLWGRACTQGEWNLILRASIPATGSLTW